MMLRFLVLALFLPSVLTAQVPALRVQGFGDAVGVSMVMHRGYPAYPATALRGLDANVQTGPDGASVQLLGDTLRFHPLSPFFMTGDSIFQMVAPAYREGGIFYLPHQFFVEWLPRYYQGQIEYDDGTLRLTAAGRARARSLEKPDSARQQREPEPEVARSPPDRIVILDPGHGGRDPGKIGPGGVREKDVTLALALLLRDSLQKRDYEVHLTRTGDEHVPLAARPRMANEIKDGRPAAIFLSLHANSAATHTRGFETFFLSEARTEEERRVAEIENAAARFDDEGKAVLDELDVILNMLRNDYYLHASHALASAIQQQLGGFHPGPNRGVKQAGFLVLVGAFMPAVLVEVGFISNPEEARLLASEPFQMQLASSLTEAVERFFDAHEHLWKAEVR